MLCGNRFVVSKGKQIVVEYRVPSDQIPTEQSVYADVIDSAGNPISDPTELTRIGSTDVVKGTITAPATVGKYEIEIWIGTWDGTNRTKSEIVGYVGLEVVDKDVEDQIADNSTKIDALATKVDSIEAKIDTIMKWLKRHPL